MAHADRDGDTGTPRLRELLAGARPGANELEDEPLIDAAERHGVLPLVADRARARAIAAPRLQARVLRNAAADALREHELRGLIRRFRDGGVVPIVVKGAHLAYTVYERSDLRPREDTDLLIDDRDRERTEALLRASGYEPLAQAGGDLVTYQTPYVRRIGGAAIHTVDLHWRLANPQRFGAVLSHDDLRAEAITIPRLDPGAVGPAMPHALLIACVHRIAHHYDAPRLIWLYDLRLLASGMEASDWRVFADLARRRGVARVCRHSLDAARRQLGAEVPAGLLETLDNAGVCEDSVHMYLGGGRHVSRIVADLSRLRWPDRVRLARQHLLPAPSYMRAVWAPGSRAPLPVLYARRAWHGARRWLARSS